MEVLDHKDEVPVNGFLGLLGRGLRAHLIKEGWRNQEKIPLPTAWSDWHLGVRSVLAAQATLSK